MKRVRLRLPPGGVHPVYRLLTDSSHVERAEGIYWNVTDGGTLTMLHRIVGDLERVEATLATVDQVAAYELLSLEQPTSGSSASSGPTSEEAYLFVHDEGTADSRQLFRAFWTAGVVVVPPIEYDDDGAAFTIVGDDGAVQGALESVPAQFDLGVTEVGGPAPTIDPTGGLSDRQREAARVGVEIGYFDVPRRASHEDVATALGCSPSTAAEHLQKAQSKLVHRAFERGEATK